MTHSAGIPPVADRPSDGGRVTPDAAVVDARRRELTRSIDAAAASIAAIKASRVYRITRIIRRVFPRAEAHEFVDSTRPTQPGTAAGPAVWDDAGEQAADSELQRLEAESRRLHHELRHLEMSRPRRAWMALKRRLVSARHPLWVAGAAVRVIGSRGVLAGARAGWHRFRYLTEPLRFQPMAEQRTDQQNPADAIRWMAPVRISGETRHALFMHPCSSVLFRTRAPRRGRFVVECGLLPSVWAENRGGVTFDVRVTFPGREAGVTRCVTSDPGGRMADRRWQRISIPLPADDDGQMDVSLATRLPDGVSPAYAWAIWGEPRIEARRSWAERWSSVAALASRLRRSGVTGTLRHVRDLQALDEHAALYRRWVASHTPTPEDLGRLADEARLWPQRPLVSVVTPVYNTDPRWLRACVESVRQQAYDNWELCLADDGSTAKGTLRVLESYRALGDPRIRITRLEVNGGISAASNAALDLARGEFIALLDHDDELAPEALAEVVRLINQAPDVDWMYSDEDKLDAAGERCDPYFKPDWSPEHFRSTMYTCHLMVLRAALVREVGGFRLGYEGAQDYDLALRISERTQRIRHIPQMLYRWRKIAGSVATAGSAKTWASDAGQRALQDHVMRAGLDAVVLSGEALGLYRVRHRIHGQPLVSIVIPTDGRSRDVGGRSVNLLVNCVRSVVETSTYRNYEIVIADNGYLPSEASAFLREVPHRLIHFQDAGPFNYARKLNFGVSRSRGSQLILFNDDIEIITPEWIEAMLEFSQQDEIGAVGAKLLYPDGRLQHIGVVMGVCGMAAHAFHSHPGSSPGYGSSALVVRNYSAVTAACMMTRRAVYERLGGFDPRFHFDFNDTDYCLRLRRDGYRIVYTPHAELYHLESATFGFRTWNHDDLAAMRARWSDVCDRDPYYNPHLTRDFPDYRVRVST